MTPNLVFGLTWRSHSTDFVCMNVYGCTFGGFLFLLSVPQKKRRRWKMWIVYLHSFRVWENLLFFIYLLILYIFFPFMYNLSLCVGRKTFFFWGEAALTKHIQKKRKLKKVGLADFRFVCATCDDKVIPQAPVINFTLIVSMFDYLKICIKMPFEISIWNALEIHSLCRFTVNQASTLAFLH